MPGFPPVNIGRQAPKRLMIFPLPYHEQKAGCKTPGRSLNVFSILGPSLPSGERNEGPASVPVPAGRVPGGRGVLSGMNRDSCSPSTLRRSMALSFPCFWKEAGSCFQTCSEARTAPGLPLPQEQVPTSLGFQLVLLPKLSLPQDIPEKQLLLQDAYG